jgi:ketosteroid isomerase-like protein
MTSEKLTEESVSRENVEIVRRAFEAFEQRGFEAAGEFFHEDFQMRQLPGFPGGTSFHGWREAVQNLTDWIGSFETFTGVPQKFIAAGEDRVVVVYYERARPREAAVEVEQCFGILFTLRDQKIGFMEWFHTPDQATRAAAGPRD